MPKRPHRSTAKQQPSTITVLDETAAMLETLPTLRVECERCGNIEAETWMVTGGSEGINSITFYRCTACGHTWRETD